MRTTPATLGNLFPPAFHRPWLRYIDTVDGDAAGTPGEPADGDTTDPAQDAAGSTITTLEDALSALANTRRDAANRRTQAKDAADRAAAAEQERDAANTQLTTLLEGMRQLFGGDKAPTPEDLQANLASTVQERDTLQAGNAALQRENAVLKLAGSLGADGARLLNSVSFLNQLATVDPSKPEDVKAVITAALTEDPIYKLTTVPGSSGGEAPTGGDQNPKPKTMADAVRLRLAKQQ